jgi:5-formyltetrahydrofolate cyclo-ligase
MKKESPSSTKIQLNKSELRSLLKERRNVLSLQRRAEASHALAAELLPLLKSYKAILSFCSLPPEIDLSFLNQVLAEEGKLYLPRVQNELLEVYQVDDLKTLIRSHWNILEPDPELCILTDLETIDCILVPGLGFDSDNRRIGYGKGHYDRLLTMTSGARSIGLGFKEQYCEEGIPFEEHDIHMDVVKLY